MKTPRNKSIKRKLIFIQSATAFIALLICTAIFLFNDLKILKESTLRKIRSVAQIVGENSVSALVFVDKPAASQILLNLAQEPDILDAALLDKNGNIFARYTRSGAHISILPITNTNGNIASELSGNKLAVSYKLYQQSAVQEQVQKPKNEQEYVGTLIIYAEISDRGKIITRYLFISGVVLLIGLTTAFIISYVLQHTITTRLRSFVDKTKQISSTGNYQVRVEPQGEDEIAELAREFNVMIEQIENMANSLKEANMGLENKVTQRTLELSQANNKLLVEIGEKRKAEDEIKSLNTELESNISELELANKELESFSYSVSHDLRAPLRAINGFTHIISDKYKATLDEDGQRYLKTVADNAEKMGKLIDDLLAFSRLGKKEIQKQSVEMKELVEAVVKEIDLSQWNPKAKITVNDLPAAEGDLALLHQVLFNLISNALKYSKNTPEPQIEIGASDSATENIYYIKDNGVGFDMKYYDKLFKVFQRLHSPEEFEGSGIGLAIVNKIVTKHGGRVWAEGRVNEGAVFYFTLPKAIVKKEPPVVTEEKKEITKDPEVQKETKNISIPEEKKVTPVTKGKEKNTEKEPVLHE
jgi:signal transduction histidine kinase